MPHFEGRERVDCGWFAYDRFMATNSFMAVTGMGEKDELDNQETGLRRRIVLHPFSKIASVGYGREPGTHCK